MISLNQMTRNNIIKINRTMKQKAMMSSVLHTVKGFEGKIFWILFSIFTLFFFLYIYFIANVVFNIVERRSFNFEALALSTKIAEMEVLYLNKSRDINLEKASELGFFEPISVGFASRPTITRVNTKSLNEI